MTPERDTHTLSPDELIAAMAEERAAIRCALETGNQAVAENHRARLRVLLDQAHRWSH